MDIKDFIIIVFLLTLSSVGLFILGNKIRIKRLLSFVEKFGLDGTLTRKEYEYLKSRYSNFLGYMEFYPDSKDYSKIYEDKEFNEFVRQTKTRQKWLAIFFYVGL